MPKNVFDNYIGCIGDLYEWVKDYAIPRRKVRKRCKWKDKKTKKRCITLLNDENIKIGNVYCSMHVQKLDYGLDTPLAPPKKSSNKKRRAHAKRTPKLPH
jgi:hypothetical protein